MGDVILLHRYCNTHKMDISNQKRSWYGDLIQYFNNRTNSSPFSIIKRVFENNKSPEEAAKCIRSNLSIYSQTTAFPIDEFARSLGIDVYTDDLTEIEKNEELAGIKGYLAIKPNNQRPVIVASKHESYGHQRWTVAHELWHYFRFKYYYEYDEPSTIPMFYTEFGKYDGSADEEENLANRFAAELLMPKRIFRSMYNRYKKVSDSPDYLLHKLSNCFKVSETAVLIRINNLRL